MDAHEEIGHQTVVSEPYRGASTAAFVVAQTCRVGARRVSSNSPPVDASCLPLHLATLYDQRWPARGALAASGARSTGSFRFDGPPETISALY